MIVPRYYQVEAENAVLSDWEQFNSTMLLMCTGSGKTEIFARIIKQRYNETHQRALVLVERNELVWQAVKKIERAGLECAVEMADLQADSGLWDRAPVVVGTVQTQVAGNGGHGRMRIFQPSDFSTLICDECHHATTSRWAKTLAWYKENRELKILGVTATGDRTDGRGLGKVFESIAYEYPISKAIADGYLVEPKSRYIEIEGLDFSGIRTTAGDLNGAELAAVLESEKPMQGMTSAMIQVIGNKQAIVFTKSVNQAELSAEIFNRPPLRAGRAGWICGDKKRVTMEERRSILQGFDDGDIQSVFNVGVLIEGWDSPQVQVVVDDSPGKSRMRYTQKIGRGTRPVAGLVDGPGMDSAEVRRAAIAASAKPFLTVLDFAGNSGRHHLITLADILGGSASAEVIERAKAKAKKLDKPASMIDLLEESKAEIRAELEERQRRESARKAHIVAVARFKMRSVDPFDVFDIRPKKASSWDEGKSLKPGQRAALLRAGININGMPYSQQKQLLLELFNRRDNKLASFKQCRALRKRGVNTDGMTFTQAHEKLNEISAKEGWKERGSHHADARQPESRPEPVRPTPLPIISDEPPWMKDLFG